MGHRKKREIDSDEDYDPGSDGDTPKRASERSKSRDKPRKRLENPVSNVKTHPVTTNTSAPNPSYAQAARTSSQAPQIAVKSNKSNNMPTAEPLAQPAVAGNSSIMPPKPSYAEAARVDSKGAPKVNERVVQTDKNASTPVVTPAAYAPPVGAEAANDQPHDEVDPEDYTEIGAISTKAVGCKYYSGIVTRGELLRFVREPANPYDRNAIRVDNTANAKVGHVPRDLAAILARLVDSGVIQLSGDVEVRVSARPAQHEMAQALLKSVLNKQLNCWDPFGKEQRPIYHTTAVYQRERDDDRRMVMEHERKHREMERRKAALDVDNLFSASFLGVSLDGSELPRVSQPNGIITSLCPHQQQALGWMATRENGAYTQLGPDRPQYFFWKYSTTPSGIIYENLVTKHRTSDVNEVSFPGGGILADDMGLGKTLSFLSLIMTQRGAHPGRTLVVAPTSVLNEWADQIDEHIEHDLLKYHVYHSTESRNTLSLVRADVVITSYGIVQREYKQYVEGGNRNKKKRKLNVECNMTGDDMGLFTKGLFYRLILDEGQQIKNVKSKRSVAIRELDIKQRWISTGTPLSNNLMELYALYAAIHTTPVSDYDVWTSCIRNPIKNKVSIDEMEAGFRRLQTLVKSTCLRRAKARPNSGTAGSQAGTVLLPDLDVQLRLLDLEPSEKALYDQIERGSRKRVEKALNKVDGDTRLKSTVNILTMLLRMRQSCCHPFLVMDKQGGNVEERADDVIKSLQELIDNDDDDDDKVVQMNSEVLARVKEMLDDHSECPVCYDEIPESDRVFTVCGHMFCRLLRMRPECPFCRTHITTNDILSMDSVKDLVENRVEAKPVEQPVKSSWVTSTKIATLIGDIQTKMQQQDKIIVFSQWSSMIDLVARQLDANNISHVSLTGKMSRETRRENIKIFQNSTAEICKVFLISLSAGGFGLNLTAASHVAMMDLWWNKSVENQAIDRAWRIGNINPKVTVWRYVARGTVEERVLQLQEAKDFVMLATFGGAGYGSKESAVKLNDMSKKAIYLVMGQRVSSTENLV